MNCGEEFSLAIFRNFRLSIYWKHKRKITFIRTYLFFSRYNQQYRLTDFPRHKITFLQGKVSIECDLQIVKHKYFLLFYIHIIC